MLPYLSISHLTGTDTVLAASWAELTELVLRYPLPSLGIVGVCGLFIGWLSRRCPSRAHANTNESTEDGTPELRWRHEKLVLVERQQVEKQARLDRFADQIAPDVVPTSALALRVFTLGERVREARQKVGASLSRMKAVRDRLDEITPSLKTGEEVVGMCRCMADTQALRLGEVQESLLRVVEEVARMENAVCKEHPETSAPVALRKQLMDLKGTILDLPQGWATAPGETDGRIRELLVTVDDPLLAPVQEVLLVDGSLTTSLAGASTIDLPGAVSAVIATLDRVITEKDTSEKQALAEALVEKANNGQSHETATSTPHNGHKVKSYFPVRLNPHPDGEAIDGTLTDEWGSAEPPPPQTMGFLSPEVGAFDEGSYMDGILAGDVDEKGQPAELANEADVDSLLDPELPERSLILFCSNDVELWGQTIYRGARQRARAITEFPDWANWISIARLDTGERVFAPILTTSLRSGHSFDPYGFNGSNELFYGARHLGLFCESCPNDVETRFTYGGWGFGHRSREIAPEIEQLQAAGWEGREISVDTVFEIVIHEELPKLGELDRLLDDEVRRTR